MEFSVSDWVDADGGAVKCFFFFHIPSNYILVPAIHIFVNTAYCATLSKKRSTPLQMRSVIKT